MHQQSFSADTNGQKHFLKACRQSPVPFPHSPGHQTKLFVDIVSPYPLTDEAQNRTNIIQFCSASQIVKTVPLVGNTQSGSKRRHDGHHLVSQGSQFT